MNFPPIPAEPHDEKYSVESMPHWSLPMAMAWILWGLPRKVQEAFENHRSGSPPMTIFDVMNNAARTDPESPDQPRFYFVDGQCQLWQHLQRGDLKARGIRPNTSVWTWIPSGKWNEIDYFDTADGRPSSVGVLGEKLPRFKDVSLLRQEIVARWPVISQPGSKPRRGRKPKPDWLIAQVLLHHECEKNGGVPGPDLDPGWTDQAHAERFVMKVLEDRRVTASESRVRVHTKKMLEAYAMGKGR